MLIEILFVILIGVIFGVICGLAPGIHPNLVAVVSLSISPFLLQYFDPLIICIFIVAVNVTNTFLNAIPNIYLGAPEAGMELSVLPGHRLLLEGNGYKAVALTVIGSLLAIIIIISLTPLLIPVVEFGYPFIKKLIPYILVLASIFLIYREKKSRLWALTIYLLAGVLGLATLNLSLSEPLFPLLSGLFGTSTLILSLLEKSKIPKQKIEFPDIKFKEYTRYLSGGTFASIICGFLPGLGSSQAAIISSSFQKKTSPESFLVLVGSIDTAVMVLSFVALYAIDKARNGSVVVISQILQTFNLDYLIIFLGATLLIGGISTILSLWLSKIFSRIMMRVNYPKLCLSIIIMIVGLVFILTGFLGILVLITATALGLIPTLRNIGKNHLMGCLLFPVILFFIL